MARWLSIDWDHDRLYVVAGKGGPGGALHLESAAVFDQPHNMQPEALQVAGESFRARLKAARISAAPAIACIGRERVVFKEIRFPPVAPEEEPGIVQFQAAKEMTEPPDRLAIDYCPLQAISGEKERRAITVAVRKEWLRALETFCTAAGIKLIGVTPRPYGIAACLQNLDPSSETPPPAPDTCAAAVVLGRRWGEFVIVRNGEVLFARPLPTNDELLGDIRRNLALFSGQMPAGPDGGFIVRSLYFAGGEEWANTLARLKEVLAFPVYSFDPLAGTPAAEGVAEDHAGFTGAVGLLRLEAASDELPINLAAPKRPVEKKDTSRLRVGLYVAAVAAFLLVAMVGANWVLGQRQQAVAEKEAALKRVENRIKALEPELDKIGQIEKWQASAIPWVERIYEVTERFPQVEGLRVTKIRINELSDPNDKYTMRMTVYGVVPVSKMRSVDAFMKAMRQLGHCRAAPGREKSRGTRSSDSDVRDFTITLDFAPEVEQSNKATKRK